MKDAIASKGAPAAIGPYSQAIHAGGLVFLSGQLAIDAETGQMVDGNTAEQAERAMRNLEAVLVAAGCSFDDVVRTTIYMVDLAEYAALNEVYGRFFDPPYPARTSVQVAALPRGARVEIDAIAVLR